MATSKKFAVKNDSERLISVGGVFIAPGNTAQVEDTPEMRATIEDVPGLSVGKSGEAKSEKPSETQKMREEAIVEANSKNTATGAGWGAAATE